MDFSEDTGILLNAIRFSADRHRNQRRKDSLSSPYINHPIDVAYLLWEVGGVRDMHVLVAAVLHDTIEDTGTRPDEIREKFGEEVLALVLEVTDDKSLPKDERKRLQIEKASKLSFGARLIKLGDKCCNIRDLLALPPENWSLERRRDYLQWGEQVVARIRDTNKALEEYFDRELASGKNLLDMIE